MQFPSPLDTQWLSTFLEATIIGNKDARATGINEIHKVQQGDIVFVDHPKYYGKCINSAATVIIINAATEVPEGKALLVVDNPFACYLKIVEHFRPYLPQTTMISDDAVIGEDTVLMPNVFVGHHVKIGSNCMIHPNVTIYDHTIIGDNVEIHSGSTIGADAFYYNTKKDRDVWYRKMKSCGRVIIENDVEIGANCCIDKGVSGDTIIGRGTKLDNLVQIGHDVVVGRNCILASQVGVAGATTIGNGVSLWGQVGVSKTLTIGDNTQVYAQSGVAGDLEGGKVYFGSPVEEARNKQKELVWVKRLPEIWERLKALERKGV